MRNRDKLEAKLKAASAKDTCWPGCAEQWQPANPAWGHCVMYTLYVNEYFEGEFIFAEASLPDGALIPHYFNRIAGVEIDLSRSQFPPGTTFQNKKVVRREEILSLPDREAERYKIFRQRARNL